MMKNIVWSNIVLGIIYYIGGIVILLLPIIVIDYHISKTWYPILAFCGVGLIIWGFFIHLKLSKM